MNILTLTMNPVLENSIQTNLVVPDKQLKCTSPILSLGSGGINVSKVIKKLGGESTALFLAGGENGDKIAALLKEDDITFNMIQTHVNSQERILIYDETTKKTFQFELPGGPINEDLYKKVFEAINQMTEKPDYIVACGSLPDGVPDDFYAELAVFCNGKGIRLVLDTVGTPLKLALNEGVYMTIPDLAEMSELIGNDSLTGMDVENAAREFLTHGYCRVLVVSLGTKGAMVAYGGDIISYINAPIMPIVSTIGVDDAMLAGIVLQMVKGLWPSGAVRYGVSAGTATAMMPGSELCRKNDVDKIYQWLCQEKVY